MKINKITKSMVFLLATLLSAGVFTGCESDAPVKVNGGGSGDDVSTSGESETGGDENSGEDEDTGGESETGGDENSGEDESTGENENTGNASVAQQKGWYVKLNVKSNTLEDKSTVFGYLQGAHDDKDRYDSEALSSNGLYTTIYHEDFGNTKHYRSDYRAYGAAGEKSDIWIIKVNSGDTNADITLSWDGITYVTKNAKGRFDEEHQTQGAELSNMRLIDVEDATVLSVLDNDMKISFNMNGKNERTFQWVLLKDGEAEPEAQPSGKMMSVRVRSMKMGSVTLEEDASESDGFTPPSFEKR